MHTLETKKIITSYINKCLIYSDAYSNRDIEELGILLNTIFKSSTLYEKFKIYPQKENDRYLLEQYINECVFDYLDKCSAENDSIFKFDLDHYIYISMKIWRDYNDSVEKESLPFPGLLIYTLKEIQSIIEHYRYFERFYSIRQNEIVEISRDTYIDIAQQTAKDVAKDIAEKTAIKITTEVIQDSINNVQIEAKLAEIQAKAAQENATTAATVAADIAVKNEMVKVTRTVSETTVTVLGIFSAIVITVVAGLIFSSSVFENISSAGLSKVILTTSVVGFVCVNILIAMFYYIDRYKYADEKKENKEDTRSIKVIIKDNIRNIIKHHFWICFINTILLILIVVSMILCIINQVMFDNQTQDNNSGVGSSNNTNINIDVSGNPSDSTTLDSFEIGTELESIETEIETPEDNSVDESKTSSID